MSWQPISSAPNDGTHFLGVDVAGDVCLVYFDPEIGQCYTWDEHSDPFDPVMWFPVDPIPEEGSDEWEAALDEWQAAQEGYWDEDDHVEDETYPRPV